MQPYVLGGVGSYASTSIVYSRSENVNGIDLDIEKSAENTEKTILEIEGETSLHEHD